jgi:hypothetical protein
MYPVQPSVRGSSAVFIDNAVDPYRRQEDFFTRRAFIDDFAGGLAALAEREEALGQVWHIPSAETISTLRFIEMVLQQVATPMRLQAPPKLAITLLAIFSPFLRAAKDTVYQSERPFVVDHSKYAPSFWGSSPTPYYERDRRDCQVVSATLAYSQMNVYDRVLDPQRPNLPLTAFGSKKLLDVRSVALYQTYLRRTGGICAPESARGRQYHLRASA